VLGSLATGAISRRIGIGPAFILGCVLFPVPLVLVPLASGSDLTILTCLFFAELLSGFGVMVLDISGGSIKAALVPDRLRARVSGAYMVVNYGVRPLGALVGGVDRPAADALDRDGRRDPRRALAAPLADPAPAGTAGGRPVSRSDLLRDRSIVALLAAEVISTTGAQMTWLALPWFVLVTTGSATRTTFVVGAR
jgi:MFS family permease